MRQALSVALQDIFIGAHQSELRYQGGAYRVVRQGEMLGSVPEGLVRGVWLMPGCSLSRRALDRLAANRTPCAFLTESGRLQACLLYPEAIHLEARLGQVRAFGDPGLRLRFASRIVEAKLAAQRLFFRSLQKRKLVGALPKSLAAPVRASDLDALRGIEGAAARDAFSLLMEAVPTEWRSPGRSYRPPTDPPNALLSLGYSIATSAILSLLLAEGLDPFLGMLHQPHHSMPALAVDLVEPFRAPLVEGWFLRTVRSGLLRPADFEPSEHGGLCLADQRLLRDSVRAFADAWTTDLVGCSIGSAKTSRDAMLVFVRSAREAFSLGDPMRIPLPH